MIKLRMRWTRAKAEACLAAYQADRSLRNRNSLIEINLPLVLSIAHKFYATNRDIDLETLYQQGSLGLIASVDRWDPHLGCSFSSYAVPYISGEIQHYLRDKYDTIRIPRDLRKRHKEYVKLLAQLKEQDLPCGPEDLAKGLQINLNELNSIIEFCKKKVILSLDKKICEGCESSYMEIKDPRSIDEGDDAVLEQVYTKLGNLDARTQEILRLYFLEGKSEPEISRLTGTQIMLVNRTKNQGLAALRSEFGIETLTKKRGPKKKRGPRASVDQCNLSKV